MIHSHLDSSQCFAFWSALIFLHMSSFLSNIEEKFEEKKLKNKIKENWSSLCPTHLLCNAFFGKIIKKSISRYRGYLHVWCLEDKWRKYKMSRIESCKVLIKIYYSQGFLKSNYMELMFGRLLLSAKWQVMFCQMAFVINLVHSLRIQIFKRHRLNFMFCWQIDSHGQKLCKWFLCWIFASMVLQTKNP